MHIAHCLTHSGVGGGQQLVYTLIKSFQQFHPEVRLTVILPGGGEYCKIFRDINITVVEFPTDKLSFFSIPKFRSMVKKLDIDIIHSHGKGAGFFNRILSSSQVSEKRVHSFHGFHPPTGSLQKMMYRNLERLLLRHTDGLVLVSQSEKNEVENTFKSIKTKSAVIQNIVDCTRLKDEILNDKTASIFKQKDDSFNICWIGRDDPVKNFPLALEAMRKVILQGNASIRFFVVGVSKENISLQNSIKEFPDCIYYIENNNDASKTMRNCELLLMTSKKEGCPLVVLESFCFGKPVIGSRVDGIKDLVSEGKNGILCNENSDDIARAILSLASDKERYQQLCIHAFNRASLMDKSAWAEQYFQFYHSLS